MRLGMLILTLALPGAFRDNAADPIDRFVQAFLSKHRIPSAAIAVVQGDRVLKLAGYGQASLELAAPAHAHTVYEIGSITKQFTAEVIMLLVGEGKLELGAPIARYLPDLPEQWQQLTVRQLLTHTSGLPDWEGPGLLDLRREYTPAEFIQLIASRPLDFVPGDRWSYTNSAFPLLGMIIESVTGDAYERVVAERIFRRAGMGETRFRHPGEVVPNRAAGYLDSSGTLRNGMPLRPALLAPNGGILSTVGDLAKWALALLRGNLVNAAAFEAMTTPVTLNNGHRFNAGMAWFVDTFRRHRVLFHNGSTAAGYSSVIYLYPEDRLFIAVLLNLDRGPAVNQLATGIAGRVVPGFSIQSLPERAERADSMRGRLFAQLKDAPHKVDRFALLDREDQGPKGVERFGVLVRWVYRYKLVSGARIIYYTFELGPDGKLARVASEEE